ncbi:hypothetical protein HAHI6034_05065 [Hathewaya histolytica]|uniref:Uncharacterized protein n=1 Tax=Hathewaya histolytica TaxID=1498 RepID=A0A4U9R641_HATHI|nr:hypothetical protein [Hathewaya histolytica]VTQ86902.1 Uncharacterised protein [Hathewaya histolytica]
MDSIETLKELEELSELEKELIIKGKVSIKTLKELEDDRILFKDPLKIALAIEMTNKGMNIKDVIYRLKGIRKQNG